MPVRVGLNSEESDMVKGGLALVKQNTNRSGTSRQKDSQTASARVVYFEYTVFEMRVISPVCGAVMPSTASSDWC